MDPDDFPIIGEPLPVEFANSLYFAGEQVIDFLATPDLITTWFALAAAGVDATDAIRPTSAESIRNLRDAIRTLLTDLALDRGPNDDALPRSISPRRAHRVTIGSVAEPLANSR